MPGLASPNLENGKILFIGDSGHGKTGAKAALVALGYKLRMIDTDNGFKVLRGLLTDEEHYPYASYMKKTGIDPFEPGRISFMPIEVPIGTNHVDIRRKSGSISYEILAPTSSRAWNAVVKLLSDGWEDPEQSYKFGKINDWENDVILDFDTLSTLAELALYWNQDMNNRLGALEDDHGRDSGAAQELIKRLLTKLTSPSLRCNVIVTTHITWTDVTRGAALSPEQLLRDNKAVDARGFPTAIGRALGPLIGKRWNDLFIAARTGNGSNAERRIYSVPVNNTDAKHSVWVEDSYPIDTGLASIFCALQYKKPPYDFLEHCAAFRAKTGSASGNSQPSPQFGGFGRR